MSAEAFSTGMFIPVKYPVKKKKKKVLCCRVSSSPVEWNQWELHAELGEGGHSVVVTKSQNVFVVSDKRASWNRFIVHPCFNCAWLQSCGLN